MHDGRADFASLPSNLCPSETGVCVAPHIALRRLPAKQGYFPEFIRFMCRTAQIAPDDLTTLPVGITKPVCSGDMLQQKGEAR